MERLTDKVRNFDGTASAKESLIDEKYHYPSDYCSKILTKLADYEDKQEQGLLIELPVAEGTEVWTIIESTDGSGEYWYIPHKTNFTLSMLSRWGKKFFLTRSEAEEALAKMGGK